jgi:hypothetical protein
MMIDLTRIAVNSVKCRRILHIKEMSFKNKSTENKLKQLSTLGPNLFGGVHCNLSNLPLHFHLNEEGYRID